MTEFSAIQRISEIQERIRNIENKIGLVSTAPKTKFSAVLNEEIKKQSSPSLTSTEAVGEVGDAAKMLSAKTASQVSAVTQVTNGNADSGDLTDLIRKAAQKYGVDPKLVSAVAEAESGGDQSVISGAGAIGVMQLMPGTAAALGVDPYDKEQNVDGGTKYLSQMIKNFGGDLRKAVAAYNAGPQAVRDYNGVPPYKETQAYVNRVLDMYQ